MPKLELPHQMPYSFLVSKEGIEYKVRDPYGRVKFHGTDASTVIQSAINALTSGRAWKERVTISGEMLIDSVVELPSFLTLDLVNSIIKLTADTSIFSITGNKSDIDIFGGILDSDNKNTLMPTVDMKPSGSYYPQKITMINTEIKNSKDAGLAVDSLRNSEFIGIKCVSNEYGLKLHKTTLLTNQGLSFSNCTFSSNFDSGILGKNAMSPIFNGCKLQRNTNYGLFADCDVNSGFSKFILNGSLITNNSQGIRLGGTYLTDYNIIANNMFRDNGLDINIPLYGSDYNSITGNTFYNTPYWGMNFIGTINKFTDNVFYAGAFFADVFENADPECTFENNLNLNPIGILSTPYPAVTGNLLNVDQAQAYPTSDAVYTVKQTAKTIIIGGGTISAIAIDGVTTGLTSGVFRLGIGETIKVTWSVQPTINQVRTE